MAMLDTARAVQDLKAAGFEERQAQVIVQIVLRAGETWPDGLATKVDLAETKADILKWMFGAIGFQTLALLGGMALLLRIGS
jgi:hypothetical protein